MAEAISKMITPAELAAFKNAFYNNTSDEADDPFKVAFETMGWHVAPATPSTGIARDVYGVSVSFVVRCLRAYAGLIHRGEVDQVGHFFLPDILEAADMIQAGEVEMAAAAKALVSSLIQTPEHTEAMRRLSAAVEKS